MINEILEELKSAIGDNKVSCWRSHGIITIVIQQCYCIEHGTLTRVINDKFMRIGTRSDGCMVLMYRE